jgi:dTMP kinase
VLEKTHKPLFIVFEGIDGSGKTTQSEMLQSSFFDNGIESRLMMEPSEGKWGRKIREILKGEDMPHAEEMLKLFILDRKDDVDNNIAPCIKGNISVILDRYYYSNAAYQGAMGLSPDHIIAENRKMGFPEPDRVYLIDVTPETALERLAGRNSEEERELFEKSAFLKKVREIYHQLAGENFLMVDGSGSIDEIFTIVKRDCMDLISRKNETSS